ncbi:MAG TPA: hypothetical protein VKA04_11620, partial [Pseudodesulfovibrio sp.]|nr:hypothetical protein [Pseudodesulfovibrio sp.]
MPLILALITAAVYVDRLTKHGQRSVIDAVNATQSSLMLLEHVTDMERNARQYQVLGDHALFDVYKSQHAQFKAAVNELRQLDLSKRQESLITELVDQEGQIYQGLSQAAPASKPVAEAIKEFPLLNSLARSVLAESSRSIKDNVGEIEALAAHAQHLLIWQVLALIPAVLLCS